MILQEFPSTFAPGFATKPVCLGCYKYVEDAQFICSDCGWPTCSKNCPRIEEMHKIECNFFAKQKVRIDASKLNFKGVEPLYDVITPLRVIFGDATNHKIFLELESHLEKWKQSPGWIEGHRFIIDYLLSKLNLETSEDEILQIFGICYTNDFSVKVDGGFDSVGKPRNCPMIRLCYALVAMCSHDCIPNTWRNILGPDQGFRHDLKARRLIRKGERICISYEDVMFPTLLRRKNLLEVPIFCTDFCKF